MAQAPEWPRCGHARSHDAGSQNVSQHSPWSSISLLTEHSRYNSHNTRERLSSLTAQKLSPIIADKDQRRTVLNAVRNITSSEVSRRMEQRILADRLQAYTKKRGRDSDLLEPLRTQPDVEAPPPSFEFNEISDVEVSSALLGGVLQLRLFRRSFPSLSRSTVPPSRPPGSSSSPGV